jgi:hypothetical protein
MKTIRLNVAILSALLLLGVATGCARVVDGASRPAPGLPPHPLLGAAMKSALLSETELGRVFKQSFVVDPEMPPVAGGADLLDANVYVPPRCGGVADMLIEDTYSGAHVRDVVRNNWMFSGSDPSVISAHEAVVGLPSIAAAATEFSSLAQRWQGCDGASTTIDGDTNFTFRISHIQDANSVLAADVQHVSEDTALGGTRAVGVRANCIVEVDLIYFDRDGDGRNAPTAADVAHLIMDKVTANS